MQFRHVMAVGTAAVEVEPVVAIRDECEVVTILVRCIATEVVVAAVEHLEVGIRAEGSDAIARNHTPDEALARARWIEQVQIDTEHVIGPIDAYRFSGKHVTRIATGRVGPGHRLVALVGVDVVGPMRGDPVVARRQAGVRIPVAVAIGETEAGVGAAAIPDEDFAGGVGIAVFGEGAEELGAGFQRGVVAADHVTLGDRDQRSTGRARIAGQARADHVVPDLVHQVAVAGGG